MVYNTNMRRLRLTLSILLLAVSIALLLWGFWPAVRVQHVLPISPSQMSLPLPSSWLLNLAVQPAI
jgi:hypothetical protein